MNAAAERLIKALMYEETWSIAGAGLSRCSRDTQQLVQEVHANLLTITRQKIAELEHNEPEDDPPYGSRYAANGMLA